MKQELTPVLDCLQAHIKKGPISFHVPGHKNGLVFPKNELYNKVLQIDVTELSGLDDLHFPEGAILNGEQLLADIYQVKKSFFLVNGSTVGNLSMILATVHEGDAVLVQRNCHKSVLNGIALAKGNPVLLSPSYDEDWGVAGGVTLDTVKKAIKAYPKAKALILTYPNYYGMVYELDTIISFAHESGIPVLIDEAHGAHFIVNEDFPSSAVQLGADVVVQSAHKTLPAMTMGSFLHFNSELVSLEKLNHYLRILQSSSPSYPIMASLDVARSYIGTFHQEDMDFLKNAVIQFKDQLNTIEGIRVLEYPSGKGDLLKVTIQSECELSGFEIQKLLEQKGIYSELADPYNVLLVLPLLKKGTDYPFKKAIEIIENVMEPYKVEKRKRIPYIQKPELACLNTDVSDYQQEVITLEKAVGNMCAETIIPYPPGIPILLPGEVITTDDLNRIRLLIKTGARFQGNQALFEGKMKIFSKR